MTNGRNEANDGERVMWKSTAQLNLMRAIGAGLVWSMVALAMSVKSPVATSSSWWTYLFVIPIGFGGLATMLIVFAKAARAAGWELGQQVVGLGAFALCVMVVVGDPLVYLLFRHKPEWVPVRTFKPINFIMILYVLAPSRAELAVS